MTTLSIPLSPELALFVEKTIQETGLTRADIVRQALKLYAEEQAVRKILLASSEPTLTGDLDELLRQID